MFVVRIELGPGMDRKSGHSFSGSMSQPQGVQARLGFIRRFELDLRRLILAQSEVLRDLHLSVLVCLWG